VEDGTKLFVFSTLLKRDLHSQNIPERRKSKEMLVAQEDPFLILFYEG
jgi:hypothetical protein